MTPAGWRPTQLLESPHRLCFFWAGVQWALGAAWWFAALVARLPAAGLPAVTLHALWFGLGALPLFIVGFLLTAGPKWVKAPPVAARGLRAGVAAFVAGWAIAVVGAALDARLAGAGFATAGAGLGLLVARAAGMVREATRADTLHPRLIVAALAVVALVHLGAALALAAGRPDALPGLARAALWWGPVAVFVVASHRMLPFLGDGVWPALDRRWPRWPLALLLSVAGVQGAWALAPGAWRDALALPVALHLVLAFAGSLALGLRWVGHPALRSPLVRMLYLAWVWWLVALPLLTGAAWPGMPVEGAGRLQVAGLHALAVGHLGGTLLAMATRVTATQQGIPQAVDRHGRGLFTLLQAAAVARVVAALWPAAPSALLAGAGLAWLLVAGAWLARHGPWLGQAPPPRRGGVRSDDPA